MWKVYRKSSSYLYVGFDASEKDAAYAKRLAGDRNPETEVIVPVCKAEMHRNAKQRAALICAAPEMLALIKEAAWDLAQGAKPGREWLEKADAAIAAAEGK
jgi:hypothetical protein